MVGARPILTTISLVLSLLMYLPQFKRILQRKSTADYSKGFMWMVLALQLNNGILAAWEHAWYLFSIYCLHIVLVGATQALIYKYYGGDNA